MKQGTECSQIETIKNIQIDTAVLKTHNTTMAEEVKEIKDKVNNIDKKIDTLPEQMTKIFVSKIEFEEQKTTLDIIKKIVYGMVSITLTLVLAGVLYLVIK